MAQPDDVSAVVPEVEPAQELEKARQEIIALRHQAGLYIDEVTRLTAELDAERESSARWRAAYEAVVTTRGWQALERMRRTYARLPWRKPS